MYEDINFAERGSNVQLYPNITFVNPANIHLKSEIIISEFCWLHGGIKLLIGNFIHIASFCSIAGGGVCILEDFVGVSAGARIITGQDLVNGEGLTNPTIPRELRAVSRSYVHLNKHAFLASNTIIHPGVTIGEGAVIGSNSVVARDIEPWTVNVGFPARPIRKRASEDIMRFEAKAYKMRSVEPLDVSSFQSLKSTQSFVPKL